MPHRLWAWSAMLVLSTGAAALLCDHLQLSEGALFGVRAIFGVAATAGIAAVLLERARSTVGPELYSQTRLVSRWVYILVYALAIVRVGLYLVEADQTHIGHTLHHRVLPPRALDDFQYYITCCLVPLWLVRALVLIKR